MGNLTTEEFRHKILLRIFFGRMAKLQNKFDTWQLQKQVAYISNQILREENIEDVWVRRCNQRTFFVYKPFNRIICQISIDGEKDGKFISNPNIVLSNLKGPIKDSLTINELIENTKALGKRKGK